MRNTERRGWSLSEIAVRLLLLILAAVLLMALQITGQLQPIQSFIANITTPAQVGATGAADNTAGAVSFLAGLRTMRQTSAELSQRNEDLLAENFALREVEQENQRLRQLLNFAQTRPSLELRGAQIVGRVIGQEANNFLESLIIDLGERHGIAVGMPVVTNQGLVGRISEVNTGTSKVLLITDSNSSVNAILQSSRLTGIVRGGPGGNLLMDYLQQGALLSVGEVVLTSGLGGNFPKGVPIGQVVQINQRDIDVFQQAVVQPTVDFNSLELVAVVTNFNPLEVEPNGQQPIPGQFPLDATNPPATETATESEQPAGGAQP